MGAALSTIGVGLLGSVVVVILLFRLKSAQSEEQYERVLREKAEAARDDLERQLKRADAESKKRDQLISSMNLEIAELEEDLRACDAPEAVRARLGRLLRSQDAGAQDAAPASAVPGGAPAGDGAGPDRRPA